MQNNFQIITKYWDKLNPLKIEDYLNVGGYGALKKFISKMKPKEVITEIKKAKLVGRGGAGFPTGEKMEKVFQRSGKKYLICNLVEAEPGNYKDKIICDKNPHLLLEGIIISALAVGAEKAYIYINGDYKKQKFILDQAIEQAYQKNFLGKKILNSQYNLEIKIFFGANDYICGEETALINSMEGNRCEPKIRPPYPTEKGLFGKPTLVDNVETLANISWIINNGGDKFYEIGSAVSPGTKLFVLSGAIKNPKIVEAPTGTTLRELIYDEGGGMPKGKEFWLAQIGGPGGKLALKDDLDIKLDFNKKSPFPLGSGSIFLVDKSVNLYDLLVSWAKFFRRESCGKCLPGREGTFRLYEIIQRFQDGKIADRDKQAIDDILWTLDNTTLCPMGHFIATVMTEALKKLKIFDENNFNKNK